MLPLMRFNQYNWAVGVTVPSGGGNMRHGEIKDSCQKKLQTCIFIVTYPMELLGDFFVW